MSFLSNNCKIDPSCNVVIPLDDRSNIGASLTAIALNFNNLDSSLCNLSVSATEIWNPTSISFSEMKPHLEEMLNVVQTYSSCWNETYDTVNTLSAFWLKPISMIYPYPFESSTTGVAELVELWLNENFPVRTGSCYNFIVGQDLYVFTPEYSEINRYLAASQAVALQPEVTITKNGAGNARLILREPNSAEVLNPNIGPFIVQNGNTTTVTIRGIHKCISTSTPFIIRLDFKIDSTVGVTVPDKFIDTVVGLKFTINPDSYTWEFVENLYNIS